MEEGDWIAKKIDDMKNWPDCYSIQLTISSLAEMTGDMFLVLSFSRCLEWLHEKNWILEDMFDAQPGYSVRFVTTHHMRGDEDLSGMGKTIDECGAKAVVKTLEEEK